MKPNDLPRGKRAPQERALPKAAARISGLLPPAIREELARAAAVDAATPRGESKTRTKVLDSAIQRIRTKYPAFFRQDKDE
jgi:hypothetical protein